jgi:hypothetical protein
MKYLVKTISIIIACPILFGAFVVLCLVWLVMYGIGAHDTDLTPTDAIKELAYCLWHLKVQEKEQPDES